MTAPGGTIHYRLFMPHPHTHLFHVEVRVDAGSEPLHFVLPSWTPGSYLIREFPGQVEGFEALAADGSRLDCGKTDKNRWRVDPAGTAEVTVRYRVHADDLSVRTSHLDASHGFVTGTSVFMMVDGRSGSRHRLTVDAPAGWEVVTELPRRGDEYEARDYDHLADSPLEIGSTATLHFEVDGVPHRYAFWGQGNVDETRLVEDTRRLVRTNLHLFGGSLPYPSFTFIVHLVPGGRGGLEHRDSTVLQADPAAFRGKAYEQFLALVAHEHLHVWNGKRVRPETLGPYDYTRENYTRNLWVMEGLTTYYTEMALRRAGIVDQQRFLDRLGGLLDRYLSQPGRAVQTLAESSFDAWIKLYRQTAHSPNSQISYYVKGAVVGLVLDLMVRDRTGDARSLDDVMQHLWRDYGAMDRGFPEESGEGIERIVREATGLDLAGEFDRWLRTTDEVELPEALASVGVRLYQPAASPIPTEEGEALRQIDRHLGVLMRRDDRGRLIVDRVRAGRPAWEAGLNARDELVAIDDAEPDPLRIACDLRVRPAERRVLRVRRRGRDVELPVAAPAGPIRGPWRLELDAAITPEQASRFRSWTRAAPLEAVDESDLFD